MEGSNQTKCGVHRYNEAMKWKITGYLLLISWMLVACSQPDIQNTRTTQATGMLTPYHSVTPSPITATQTVEVMIPATPAPTATPFLHTVTTDDTLLGIAFHYGVKLEDLEAANPGVDPHFLSVGMKLVIPISGEIPAVVPTTTPMPVTAQASQCFRSGDGGAWCITGYRNDNDVSVENISAWFGLYSQGGILLTSQVADAPLNLLLPGKTMPVMAYFPPPLAEEFTVHAELLSALPVVVDDQRYLKLETKNSLQQISADGKSATLRGEAILPPGTSQPKLLWVLGIAYDREQRIVAVRRWESTGEMEFELTLYSLGGMIDHTDVLIEARP